MSFWTRLFGRKKPTKDDIQRSAMQALNNVGVPNDFQSMHVGNMSQAEAVRQSAMNSRLTNARQPVSAGYVRPASPTATSDPLTDPTSPLSMTNPLNPLSPLSPFNPINQTVYSSPSYTPPDTSSSFSSDTSSSSSSSSFDSGSSSSSSFDSGSSSGGGDSGGGGGW